MKKNHLPIDPTKIKTYPLSERKNRVRVKDFAQPLGKQGKATKLLNSFPHILAGETFREVVKAIVYAYHKDKIVILAMGAHVIKCGLSPIIIDLMKRGIIEAIALNGAGAIHDFEIALIGETSEDVAEGLEKGTLGLVEETGRLMNEAINGNASKDTGMGYVLGEKLIKLNAPYNKYSVLTTGVQLGIPVTVHVAIGTDIIHMHPMANGAATGDKSFIDFRLFCSIVSDLNNGGVFLNVGSAVILPEVFLKALTLARNLEYKVENFTTVNLDMYQHYRPTQNVVKRPTSKSGKGHTLLGRHEILIPLLAMAVIEAIEEKG